MCQSGVVIVNRGRKIHSQNVEIIKSVGEFPRDIVSIAAVVAVVAVGHTSAIKWNALPKNLSTPSQWRMPPAEKAESLCCKGVPC